MRKIKKIIPSKNNLILLVLSGGIVILSACSMEKTPKQVMSLPEADSQAAVLFKKFCRDCHAPPPPASRTGRQWQSILVRMQNHRIMQGMEAMTLEDQQVILQYLEKYALES